MQNYLYYRINYLRYTHVKQSHVEIVTYVMLVMYMLQLLFLESIKITVDIFLYLKIQHKFTIFDQDSEANRVGLVLLFQLFLISAVVDIDNVQQGV